MVQREHEIILYAHTYRMAAMFKIIRIKANAHNEKYNATSCHLIYNNLYLASIKTLLN